VGLGNRRDRRNRTESPEIEKQTLFGLDWQSIQWSLKGIGGNWATLEG